MGDVFDKLSPPQLPITNGLQESNKLPVIGQETPQRTLSGTLGDIGISAAKSIVGAGESAVGLADIPTFGAIGKALSYLGYDPQETRRFLESGYSPAQKEANRRVQEAKGFLDTAKSMVENPSTIGLTALESLPSMAMGGAIGRGLLLAKPSLGILASAIGEGAISAGQNLEQVREQTKSGFVTPKQVAMQVAAGGITGAIALVGGRLAQKFGFADPDLLLAGIGTKMTTGSVAKRILEGFVSEGIFEELPQSAQEQVWQNAATNRPLLEGVPQQAIQGLFVGGLMGAGANVPGVAGVLTRGKNVTEEEKKATIEAVRNLPIEDLQAFINHPETKALGIGPEIAAIIEQRKKETALKAMQAEPGSEERKNDVTDIVKLNTIPSEEKASSPQAAIRQAIIDGLTDKNAFNKEKTKNDSETQGRIPRPEPGREELGGTVQNAGRGGEEIKNGGILQNAPVSEGAKKEEVTARFEGYQDMSPVNKPPMPMYTVKGGELDGSTVSRQTLEENGIPVPETPEAPVQPSSKKQLPPPKAIEEKGKEQPTPSEQRAGREGVKPKTEEPTIPETSKPGMVRIDQLNKTVPFTEYTDIATENLGDKTVPQLRKLAKSLGVTEVIKGKGQKKRLIEAIQEVGKDKIQVEYRGKQYIVDKKNATLPVDPIVEAQSRIKDSLKNERGSISFAKIKGTPLYDDLLTVAKHHINQGIKTFQEFHAKMKQVFTDVWDRIRRLVRPLWANVKKTIGNEVGSIEAKIPETTQTEKTEEVKNIEKQANVEPPKEKKRTPEEFAQAYVKRVLESAKKGEKIPLSKPNDPFGVSGDENSSDRAKSIMTRHFNDFMYWVVNENRPIHSIQKKIQNITEETDLFLRETQRPKITANRIKEAWNNDVVPFLQEIAKRKKELPEVELYSHAKHAAEANEALRLANSKLNYDKGVELLNKKQKLDLTEKVKSDLGLITIKELKTPKQYNQALNVLFNNFTDVKEVSSLKKRWDKFSERASGMSDKEANLILNEYKNDKDIEHLRGMLASINARRLEILKDAGLLSKEEYKSIKSKYQFYVPLYREGFEGQGQGAGKGLQPAGRPIKIRSGSTKNVVNIIANSVSNLENAINRAEKADSAKTLYNLIKENPNPDFWSISDVPKSPHYDNYGNLREYPDLFKAAPNEMRIMVNGRQHLIKVNKYDKDAMRMLKTLKAQDTSGGPMINALSKVNRWLARINTSWSPEFIITNWPRDIQTAGVNIHDTGVAPKRLIRGALEGVKTIYNVERGKNTGNPLEAYYDRFKKAGGKIGWPDVHGTVENLSNKITKELETLQGKRPIRKTAMEWIQWIEDMNTAVENGVRLHIFRLAVDQGLSDKKAGQIASDVTVDFTTKGAAGPVINSLYLFANAGIQGSYRIIRALIKSNKIRGIAGGIIGAGFLTGLINVGLGGKDDDGEDYFNKLDDFIRERNMIFMLPGTKGKYVKIPLPWGYNVFWNVGTELSRMFTKENYRPLNGASRLASTFVNAFNPIASGTLLQTLAPTVLDPFVMVAENKNWFGGDLMPTADKFAKVPTPDSQRYWRSASEPSKWVAQELNKLTGGNKIKKGLVDVSPETLDLILDSVGGSMLKFFKDSSNLPLRVIKREQFNIYSVPFLRRVYGEKSEWADSRIYRDNVTQILTARDELKAYRGTDYYFTLLKKTRPIAGLINSAEITERQIGRLIRLKNKRMAQGNEIGVKSIEKEILRIQKAFNLKFNRIHDSKEYRKSVNE